MGQVKCPKCEYRPFTASLAPCVLCGAPHGTPCNTEAHKQLDRELARFAKVGSTDVCGKCGKRDCDHLKGSPGFFHPVRSLLITGIADSQGVGCQKCGAVNCTKNHAEFT